MSSTTYNSASKQQKEAIKEKIRNEVPYVDVAEHSHHIIRLRMSGLNDEDASEVATQTDLHRLGWEYMCDKSKYPLSENDIHENKIAWLLRRTAIRKNGGCGETAQGDHDKCFMCDKDIAETKVECANCYLTHCEDCFGEGMDGCKECNDIMYADSDDESDDDEEDCNYTANCVWCDKCKSCRWCDNCDCEENKIGYDCCICDESDDE